MKIWARDIRLHTGLHTVSFLFNRFNPIKIDNESKWNLVLAAFGVSNSCLSLYM